MKGKCLCSSPKWYLYCFLFQTLCLKKFSFKFGEKLQICILILISCSHLALRSRQDISLAFRFSNLHFILFQFYWLVLKIFLNAPKQQTLMATVINEILQFITQNKLRQLPFFFYSLNTTGSLQINSVKTLTLKKVSPVFFLNDLIRFSLMIVFQFSPVL